MAELNLVQVTVWELRRRGRLQEIALAPEEFERPRRGRVSIRSHPALVGEVRGQISDWNAGGGYAKHLKLHWTCPACNFEDWGDWLPGTPNPCLWFGHCHCADKWLISYDPKTVNTPAK